MKTNSTHSFKFILLLLTGLFILSFSASADVYLPSVMEVRLNCDFNKSILTLKEHEKYTGKGNKQVKAEVYCLVTLENGTVNQIYYTRWKDDFPEGGNSRYRRVPTSTYTADIPADAKYLRWTVKESNWLGRNEVSGNKGGYTSVETDLDQIQYNGVQTSSEGFKSTNNVNTMSIDLTNAKMEACRFVSIQKCTSWWSATGQEYMKWLDQGSADIRSLKSYGDELGLTFEPNNYYRVKFAIAGAQGWKSVSQLIYFEQNGQLRIAASDETHSVAPEVGKPEFSLTEDVALYDVSVYPNPFDHELIITANRATEYVIYSTSGIRIKSGIIEESTVISTDDFASGIYLVHLVSGDSKEVVRIVKK